ncbi:uncharacterized protein LOC132162002 isoform X1 [Corylus avellana]|uniref:uncharacterized protein LOC132162002 isoform X1 n=1 Tax=Corylus avellana TaxID=13451 RepID=UPI001E1FED0C|nr:uncharacterized protein LOC132162002 isoform X1 [Corylus avellana]
MLASSSMHACASISSITSLHAWLPVCHMQTPMRVMVAFAYGVRGAMHNVYFLIKSWRKSDQLAAALYNWGSSAGRVRSIAGSVAVPEAPVENQGNLRSIADRRSKQSHSYRKAETQYGKILYIPQPPMTACKVGLGVSTGCNQIVCKRKEAQELKDLETKLANEKISFSL